MLAAVLRTVRVGGIVAGRGQQREGGQPGRGTAVGARSVLHRAQHQPLGLDDLGGAGDGRRREGGCGGVGVGEHGDGGVLRVRAGVVVGGGQHGGLVEEFLDVLAEPPVVQAQHEPQPGVETAGGEGGADVGLVVVVHEGQGGGPVDAGVGEDGLGGFGGLDEPFAAAWFARAGGAAAAVDGGHDDPVEQGGRDRAGAADDGRAYGAAAGGHDEGDLFAVDAAQFGGEPVRQPVVPAHDHMGAGLTGRALIRNARHGEQDCLTGGGGSRGTRGLHSLPDGPPDSLFGPGVGLVGRGGSAGCSAGQGGRCSVKSKSPRVYGSRHEDLRGPRAVLRLG
ncbi:hypothetical protein GCM10020256_34220 [Streptomyces thermocoprophilus]